MSEYGTKQTHGMNGIEDRLVQQADIELGA